VAAWQRLHIPPATRCHSCWPRDGCAPLSVSLLPRPLTPPHPTTTHGSLPPEAAPSIPRPEGAYCEPVNRHHTQEDSGNAAAVAAMAESARKLDAMEAALNDSISGMTRALEATCSHPGNKQQVGGLS
jgi:hypothetical protein